MSKALDQIGWILMDFCRRNDLKLEREYRFHEKRMWRFDWAVPEKKWAFEFNGGVFMSKSGHSNAKGQTRDQEKSNQAQLLGWKVLTYNAKNYKQLSEDLEKITEL